VLTKSFSVARSTDVQSVSDLQIPGLPTFSVLLRNVYVVVCRLLVTTSVADLARSELTPVRSWMSCIIAYGARNLHHTR
jgi:hypothetical protein